MLNTRNDEDNKGFNSYLTCYVTPPLTLTTAMQIAAAYGGDEL